MKTIGTFVVAALALAAWTGPASAAWLQKKDHEKAPDQSAETSADIPAYFYGEHLGQCDLRRNGRVATLNDDFVRLRIRKVIGYDWDSDHHRNSDSLTVRHDRISRPARLLFAVTHHALSNEDPSQIQEAVSIVVDIARADSLLDTMTVHQVKNMGSRCYEGKGKTAAKCWAHAPQFAAQFAGNYLVSAIHLKPHMDEDQRKVVDSYARKLYKKYIKPGHAEGRQWIGFQQMANGGISVLAYAAWSEDRKLAEKTFGRIFRNIRKVFYKDGYINNSSFRGVRGFWYHTYGVNSALAVMGLAEAWNVEVPKVVADRVQKSVELINVGVSDLDRFNARKFSGYRGNASTNPRDARPHIHQMAIAIDAMAERYADVTLKHDATYIRKRRGEGPSDFTLGFHPECMIRQDAPT